jgi:hypothetical protein
MRGAAHCLEAHGEYVLTTHNLGVNVAEVLHRVQKVTSARERSTARIAPRVWVRCELVVPHQTAEGLASLDPTVVSAENLMVRIQGVGRKEVREVGRCSTWRATHLGSNGKLVGLVVPAVGLSKGCAGQGGSNEACVCASTTRQFSHPNFATMSSCPDSALIAGKYALL